MIDLQNIDKEVADIFNARDLFFNDIPTSWWIDHHQPGHKDICVTTRDNPETLGNDTIRFLDAASVDAFAASAVLSTEKPREWTALPPVKEPDLDAQGTHAASILVGMNLAVTGFAFDYPVLGALAGAWAVGNIAQFIHAHQHGEPSDKIAQDVEITDRPSAVAIIREQMREKNAYVGSAFVRPAAAILTHAQEKMPSCAFWFTQPTVDIVGPVGGVKGGVLWQKMNAVPDALEATLVLHNVGALVNRTGYDTSLQDIIREKGDDLFVRYTYNRALKRFANPELRTLPGKGGAISM